MRLFATYKFDETSSFRKYLHLQENKLQMFVAYHKHMCSTKQAASVNSSVYILANNK